MVETLSLGNIVEVLMGSLGSCPAGTDTQAIEFVADGGALVDLCEEVTQALHKIVADAEPGSTLEVSHLRTGRESVDYGLVRTVSILRPEVLDETVHFYTKRGLGRLEEGAPKTWGFYLRVSASNGPEKGRP